MYGLLIIGMFVGKVIVLCSSGNMGASGWYFLFPVLHDISVFPTEISLDANFGKLDVGFYMSSCLQSPRRAGEHHGLRPEATLDQISPCSSVNPQLNPVYC